LGGSRKPHRGSQKPLRKGVSALGRGLGGVFQEDFIRKTAPEKGLAAKKPKFPGEPGDTHGKSGLKGGLRRRQKRAPPLANRNVPNVEKKARRQPCREKSGGGTAAAADCGGGGGDLARESKKTRESVGTPNFPEGGGVTPAEKAMTSKKDVASRGKPSKKATQRIPRKGTVIIVRGPRPCQGRNSPNTGKRIKEGGWQGPVHWGKRLFGS